jgi:hypothetical protein
VPTPIGSPAFLPSSRPYTLSLSSPRRESSGLSDFYSNRFALTGLEYWPELEGRTYAQLPSKIRDGIDRRYISSIILLQETAATKEQATRLKKMVFERLNSGGVKLSNQETRNAIYDGPLNSLCLELSADPDFKRMWGIPAEAAQPTGVSADDDGADDETSRTAKRMYEQMEDVEMVLRFFAYRQLTPSSGGLNKISAFLDQFLDKGNSFAPELISKYRLLFRATVSFLNAAWVQMLSLRSDSREANLHALSTTR